MNAMIFMIWQLYLLFGIVNAAFNLTNDDANWAGNSVQPNQAGRFCYFPGSNQTNATYCSGGHSQDSYYQPVLDIHLKLPQGWSIAYYSIDNVLLGDVNFPVPKDVNTTRQCLSGRAGDGNYQTFCMTTTHDNNIVEAGSYCQVAVAQHYVSDGCYEAMSNETSTSSGPTSTASTPSTAPEPASSGSGSDSNLVLTIVTSVVIPLVVVTLSFLAALFQFKGFREWTVDYCCCCLSAPKKDNLKAKGKHSDEKSEKANSELMKE